MRYPTAFLTALCLSLASLSAKAQMADRITEHPTPREASRQEVIAQTREMAKRLHLNEGQYLQLLPLNRTRLSALNSINREYRADATTRAAKSAELEAQFEQECSRILTPSQLSQLQRDAQPATVPATTGNGLG
jgi:Spy/CpxP family protein refolding chaperone